MCCLFRFLMLLGKKGYGPPASAVDDTPKCAAQLQGCSLSHYFCRSIPGYPILYRSSSSRTALTAVRSGKGKAEKDKGDKSGVAFCCRSDARIVCSPTIGASALSAGKDKDAKKKRQRNQSHNPESTRGEGRRMFCFCSRCFGMSCLFPIPSRANLLQNLLCRTCGIRLVIQEPQRASP